MRFCTEIVSPSGNLLVGSASDPGNRVLRADPLLEGNTVAGSPLGLPDGFEKLEFEVLPRSRTIGDELDADVPDDVGFGERVDVESIKSVLLACFSEQCEKGLHLVDVAEQYVQFVAFNPGLTQSGLGGALGVDQQVARRIGWYLAELGVVDRVREKHSYRLYITDD